MSAPTRVLALALALAGVLAGCGGGRGDTTAPDPDPQVPQVPEVPQGPGTPAPSVAGHYVLEQINGSKPGTLVTIANPGGTTTQGAQTFTFRSAEFDDAFVGVVLDDVVAIQYDLDGDGQAETALAFRRAN
jgi:hypothetical protein